jgi:hypothetical protein
MASRNLDRARAMRLSLGRCLNSRNALEWGSLKSPCSHNRTFLRSSARFLLRTDPGSDKHARWLRAFQVEHSHLAHAPIHSSLFFHLLIRPLPYSYY